MNTDLLNRIEMELPILIALKSIYNRLGYEEWLNTSPRDVITLVLKETNGRVNPTYLNSILGLK